MVMEPDDTDSIGRAHLQDPAERTHTIARRLPSDHLRAWIRRYWIPVWDVPEGETSEQTVLQYPVCLSITTPAYSRFVGPHPGVSRTVLEGRSWGFGTMFAPAAGAKLFGQPVRDLAGSWCDLDEVSAFAGLTGPVRALMAQAPEDPEIHARCCALLEDRIARLGAPDEEDLLINDVVDLVEQDHGLLTVAQLSERMSIGERTLQRLTVRRLGLTPLWLIRRRRVHDASAGLRSVQSFADLAIRLGYADQAHFSRDFRASTGLTPGEFAARWR